MKVLSNSHDADWHAQRNKLLTGSNAAYAVVAMEYDGNLEEIETEFGKKAAARVSGLLGITEDEDLSNNNHVFWGSRSERHNMDVFVEASGVRCVHTSKLVTRDFSDIPLASTLDAIGEVTAQLGLTRPVTAAPVRWKRTMEEIQGWEGLFPVELKQTSRPNLREWSGNANDLPFGYRSQVQVQMWAMSVEHGLVVGKVGVADMRVIPVYYSEELISKIIEASQWLASRRSK
jgi:hypothetical protein